jgi:hypothetical protein
VARIAELFDESGDFALQGDTSFRFRSVNGGQIVRLAFDRGVTPVERFPAAKAAAQHRAVIELSVNAVGGAPQ